MDEIKKMTRQFIPEMKRLYNYSFHDLTCDFVNFWYENLISFEDTLGYINEGNLVSVLQIQPLEIHLNRKIWKMGGIGGVATLPEARSKGFAGKLLIKALEDMRDSEMIVSMLAPFSYEYYRKYGWELAMTKTNYTIPVEYFRKFKSYGKMNKISCDDFGSIAPIYEKYAGEMNLMIHENDLRWKNFIFFGGLGAFMGLKDKTEVYKYTGRSGNVEGYIIYALIGDKLHVLQMVALKFEAMEGIFSFFNGHTGQVKSICWACSSDSRLMALLDDPRVSAEVHPSMMFRVVDVKKALLYNSYPEDVRVSVEIQIDDVCAPWNGETIHLEIEGGNARIGKRKGECTLKCTIQAFSQFFSGYTGLDETLFYGKAEVEGAPEAIKSLCKAFTKRITNIDFGF